jgi:hypothetical protein
VELAAASGSNTASGLIVAAPSYVFTISRVAEMLGEDQQWLQTIADDMEPEDGCLTVCGTDDLSTMAFTPFGIESLKELLPIYRREPGEG